MSLLLSLLFCIYTNTQTLHASAAAVTPEEESFQTALAQVLSAGERSGEAEDELAAAIKILETVGKLDDDRTEQERDFCRLLPRVGAARAATLSGGKLTEENAEMCVCVLNSRPGLLATLDRLVIAIQAEGAIAPVNEGNPTQ